MSVKQFVRAHFVLALVAALSAVVHAQESKPKASDPEYRQPQSSEVEQLKSKVEQLQTLLERQQQLLVEMQSRMDEIEGKPKLAAAGLKSEVPKPDSSQAPIATASASASQKVPANATSQANAKPALLAGWENNRAILRSEDGSFETQITGYGQLDGRSYAAGDHPPNTFVLRRARMTLEGRVNRYFDFRIEGDFADTVGTPLRDLYVNVHRIDEAQFRFGQFKVPMSQEEIRSDAFQDFVERSLVNNLVPSRSPGIGMSGVINKGAFEYQIGAFNGKGLLASNTSNTPEAALRLRFNPWKNTDLFWAKGLIFGGAFTQGRSNGGLSVRGLTESRSSIFFQSDTVNGKYIRANGEFTWLLGTATIRAEYDQTNQSRDNLGTNGTNLPGVVAKGYMAQATYLLTGETKPESAALSPRTNLFEGDKGHGFGAWELKFRYANLQIADGTAKSNRAETFYFGPNWYLNRFVRYVMDLGIERYKDPARSPNPADRNYFVMLNRIQVSF